MEVGMRNKKLRMKYKNVIAVLLHLFLHFYTNTQRRPHSKMHLLLTIVQNQVDVYLVFWHLFKEFVTFHGFSSLLQRLSFDSLLLFACVLCNPIFKRFILIHNPGNQMNIRSKFLQSSLN